jgi:tRNA 2-thiouridine synthesizing protein A
MHDQPDSKRPTPSLVHLDLRGLKCPLPALKTGRALDGLAAGARMRVETTDPMAAIDIPHLLRQRGDRLEAVGAQDGVDFFIIERVVSP